MSEARGVIFFKPFLASLNPGPLHLNLAGCSGHPTTTESRFWRNSQVAVTWKLGLWEPREFWTFSFILGAGVRAWPTGKCWEENPEHFRLWENNILTSGPRVWKDTQAKAHTAQATLALHFWLKRNECLDQEQMAKSSRRSLSGPVGSQRREQEHRGSWRDLRNASTSSLSASWLKYEVLPLQAAAMQMMAVSRKHANFPLADGVLW